MVEIVVMVCFGRNRCVGCGNNIEILYVFIYICLFLNNVGGYWLLCFIYSFRLVVGVCGIYVSVGVF